MSQKSSLPQAAKSVSRVLMSDTSASPETLAGFGRLRRPLPCGGTFRSGGGKREQRDRQREERDTDRDRAAAPFNFRDPSRARPSQRHGRPITRCEAGPYM